MGPYFGRQSIKTIEKKQFKSIKHARHFVFDAIFKVSSFKDVLRAEPLIIVGGGVGQNREKKKEAAVPARKKKSKCLVGSEKKSVAFAFPDLLGFVVVVFFSGGPLTLFIFEKGLLQGEKIWKALSRKINWKTPLPIPV